MARKQSKGAATSYYKIVQLIDKIPYLTDVRSFCSQMKKGFVDACKLRLTTLLILVLLMLVVVPSSIVTFSFYRTCNKVIEDNKVFVGDFELLQNLDTLELEQEQAYINGDIKAQKDVEDKITKLSSHVRNIGGEHGARVGQFFCNGLFGYGSMVLFLACFVIISLFCQRILFPIRYSWYYFFSRSLLYGVFILGGLTLWSAVVAHLIQDYAHERPPLLWGGELGKQIFDAVKSSSGLLGLGLFIIGIPLFYYFIITVIRISPEEKAKRKAEQKAEEKFNQRQKEREEKEREKELERITKQREKERLAELEAEARQKELEEAERREAEELKVLEAQLTAEKKERKKAEGGDSFLGKALKGLKSFCSIGSGIEEVQAEEEVQPVEELEPVVAQEAQEKPSPQVVEEPLDVHILPVNPPVAEQPKQDGSGKLEIEDKTEDTDLLKPEELEEQVIEDYVVPSVELLEDHGKNNEKLDRSIIDNNAQRIIDELRKFGIEVSVPNATVGPTITLYELKLGDGVRISKISNLDEDIAMALKAEKVRIIAPIPGRGTVGVEVPNPKVQTVSMRSMIASSKFNECKNKMQLPIAIGKTITNESFVFDLAKTPHLLIAGATGQGKSVGLNALITSILYSKTPDEVKLVMVDPKMLEFAVYEGISEHYLIKTADADKAIITDMSKVMPTLKSLCEEMDDRYQRLKDAGVRNIVEYNNHFKDGKLSEEEGHNLLPYIVVIIDEFADLMMTAGSAKKEVELLISRLAQKARAAGIHLVMATQRPSTDVITGLIKANFPARIAFRVFSQIDSRTILDGSGANQLIGRGDMLYYSGQNPQRVQCAFVDTPEIERIVEHIATQPKPQHQFDLPECPDEEDEFDAEAALTKIDPLLKEVARMVVETRVGSTSNIQRRFEVGYNKAGRIMDQMQALGIVGPQQGSKPRAILVYDLVELDELFVSKGL